MSLPPLFYFSKKFKKKNTNTKHPHIFKNNEKTTKQEYADFPEILPFITATPATAILERPVVDRAPVPQWGFLDGRVLLIGDAVRCFVVLGWWLVWYWLFSCFVRLCVCVCFLVGEGGW